MQSFDELLVQAVARHGHLCAGQVIGVRMAMLGLHLLGIENPKAPDVYKTFLVYVEIDRCATDAIASVTGAQLGKRSLKFMDYGINAATFVSLKTGDAYRIISTESSREHVKEYARDETEKSRQQLIGYQNMPDELLFTVQRVSVKIPETDLPGSPRSQAVCIKCGQVVRDGREIETEYGVICAPCSDRSYFKVLDSISLEKRKRV